MIPFVINTDRVFGTHSDEWTESGLHIREKKDEPVKTAQALARRRWRRIARHRF
jgi:hypothetical protein